MVRKTDWWRRDRGRHVMSTLTVPRCQRAGASCASISAHSSRSNLKYNHKDMDRRSKRTSNQSTSSLPPAQGERPKSPLGLAAQWVKGKFKRSLSEAQVAQVPEIQTSSHDSTFIFRDLCDNTIIAGPITTPSDSEAKPVGTTDQVERPHLAQTLLGGSEPSSSE